MIDEALINAVRDHPVLYDQRATDYKDLAKKEAAWKKVAETVAATAPECRHRWKALRDTFVREKER